MLREWNRKKNNKKRQIQKPNQTKKNIQFKQIEKLFESQLSAICLGIAFIQEQFNHGCVPEEQTKELNKQNKTEKKVHRK